MSVFLLTNCQAFLLFFVSRFQICVDRFKNSNERNRPLTIIIVCHPQTIIIHIVYGFILNHTNKLRIVWGGVIPGLSSLRVSL